jgi:hypothetical protein
MVACDGYWILGTVRAVILLNGLFSKWMCFDWEELTATKVSVSTVTQSSVLSPH